MPKKDSGSLIKQLKLQITGLESEIKKREAIISLLQELEGRPALPGTVRRGRKPGRKGKKRGRKPGVMTMMRAKRKPGPKPGMKRRGRPGRPPGRPGRPGRKATKISTADVMADLVKRMNQPTLDELANKLHQAYPKMGGVKYRSVVASIVSRDPRFEKTRGNRVSLKG